jgi:hypothetical protein
VKRLKALWARITGRKPEVTAPEAALDATFRRVYSAEVLEVPQPGALAAVLQAPAPVRALQHTDGIS